MDARATGAERRRSEREARKAAEKAGAERNRGQRRAEFRDGEQKKKAAFSLWRKVKGKKNRMTGRYNGSRKPDRNIANRKNGNATAAEEINERLETAACWNKVDTAYLKGVMAEFGKIADPRHPGYITYTLPELLFFGLAGFRFHAGSRRESNAKLSPVLLENLRVFFPEVGGLPHADTLGNLLERTDPVQVEAAGLSLVDRLIRNKKLDPFRISGRIPVVIDGVHKYTRDYEWCLNALEKKAGGKDADARRYYANALEASIMLPDGHTLPLMTEFMDRDEYGDCGTDTEKSKQDCETNAAKRLVARLREWHPNLKISLSMDGLYATGPMLMLCLQKDIDVMVVLQDKSLPCVWEEINAHIASGMCGTKLPYECNDVRQEFYWVNNIPYSYDDGENHVLDLHAAVCRESRTVFDKKAGTSRTTKSTFAWISLKQFNQGNVGTRCNSLGRPRRNIETQNRIEKYDGYAYSHCFSYDWNAMKCHHFLMQIAYILNMLALLSTGLAPIVKRIGYRQTIAYIHEIYDGMRWDAEEMRARMPERFQIRWAI